MATAAADPVDALESAPSPAQGERVIATPSEPPQSHTVAAPPPSVAQELLALLRLHCWGFVDAARLFGRDVTLILLIVFSLALWMGLDRLSYDGEVELFVYGATENAAVVLAVLAVAWLLSRVSRPRVEMRQALLLVLSFLPIFIAFL